MNDPSLAVPPELEHLSTFIGSHIECLSGPSGELRSIALCAAKHIFDWALETEKSSKPHLEVLLATLTQAVPPQTRAQLRSTSTQRRSPIQKPAKKINVQETPLPTLFIEDMNADQIWQQLDLRATRVCENLKVLQGKDTDESTDLEGESSEDIQIEEEEDEEEEEMDVDESEKLWEELSSGEENGSSTAEGVANLEDETAESEDHEDDVPPSSMLDVVRGQQKLDPSGSYSPGRSVLDDGFFDLATFNAETSKAETNDVSKRKTALVADEDSAEELEVDLFGSVDDTESGADDSLELFYNDFFEPPPRIQNGTTRSSKVRFRDQVSIKKIKPVGKGMPVSSMGNGGYDEEGDGDD